MPTLTVSKARQKLGQYVDQAHEGQCIVIVHNGRHALLTPVEVYPEGWYAVEYGITREEAGRVSRNLKASITRERKAGRVRTLTGSLKEHLRDEN